MLPGKKVKLARITVQLKRLAHVQGKNVTECWLWAQYHASRTLMTQRYCIDLSITRVYVNPLKTKRICIIYELGAYRAVNTLHFDYKNQSLNAL
jgi:hypothetical protein